MVFQDDAATRRFWSLMWPPVSKNGARSLGKDDASDTSTNASSDNDSDCSRTYDVAESLELGLAREVSTSAFTRPLLAWGYRRSLHISASKDGLRHRLFSEAGELLLFAQVLPGALRRVDLHLYGPQSQLHDAGRPAFTLTCDAKRREWLITQSQCDCCRALSGRKHPCVQQARHQLAVIRHSRESIGEGLMNRLVAHLPQVAREAEGVGVVGDFGASVRSLDTVRPKWDKDIGGLVLPFMGRHAQASPRNFQLTEGDREAGHVFQLAYTGSRTYSLDYGNPVSLVQAFGLSLTTLLWT